MFFFFSDLDRTLIFSHRIAIGNDKVLIETLKGKEQSYVTRKTYSFFSSLPQLKLIPVTSRTEEQYYRISDTFSGFNCDYVLISNGSILLENGHKSTSWICESLDLAKPEIPSFQKVRECALKEYGQDSVIDGGELMFYVRTSDPTEVEARLKEIADQTRVAIYHDNRKVYCCPYSNNKGNAILRLVKKLDIPMSIAAGDGIQDISMLNNADIAIIPKALDSLIKNPNKRILEGRECFSDFICDELEKFFNT